LGTLRSSSSPGSAPEGLHAVAAVGLDHARVVVHGEVDLDLRLVALA
jgi:hypothetical protein